MSILTVLPLVNAYNADKPSIFATDKNYVLTETDMQKVVQIFKTIQQMKLPYDVSLKICPSSGQLYLKCTEKAKQQDTKRAV